MKKLKLKKFYEKIYEHIKKNIKGKKKLAMKNIIGDYGLWW